MLNIKNLLFLSLFFSCFFKITTCNAQKINQYNSHQQRTGVWKKYYSNKRIRYVGQFENGKEVGVFKFYDITSSKHPIAVKKYDTQTDSVFVKFYTISGILQSQGTIYHRKREGKWSYYFKNGKILSQEIYKNGKLEGKVFVYYPKGNITEISNYRNGLKEGVSKKFSDSDVLLEEENYQKGLLNGEAKYYDIKGGLKEKGLYKEGKRIGKWEFYIDGELATEEDKKKHQKRK